MLVVVADKADELASYKISRPENRAVPVAHLVRRLVCNTRCESFCGFGMVMTSSRVCRRNRGVSAPSSPVRYRETVRDRVPFPKRRREPPSGFPVPPVLFKVAPATRIHTTMLAISTLLPAPG